MISNIWPKKKGNQWYFYRIFISLFCLGIFWHTGLLLLYDGFQFCVCACTYVCISCLFSCIFLIFNFKNFVGCFIFMFACFLMIDTKKGCGSGWLGRREDLEWGGQREIIIRIDFIKIQFQLKLKIKDMRNVSLLYAAYMHLYESENI